MKISAFISVHQRPIFRGASMKNIPVILFGAGGVGRELLRQIVNGREVTAARNQVQFDVVAVVDSRSWLWQPAGLTDEAISRMVAAKMSGQAIGETRPSDPEILAQVEGAGLGRALVVDVTAAGGMEPVIDLALAAGHGVVLANKKPLAGPWSQAQRYFNNPQLRHESTVGGGQPIIATLRYLLDTNDPVRRIQGQMSGTLGFICGLLDEGVPFSQALAEAKTRGYTEPDPREDLGGQDNMRKIMILGRLNGWPLEPADIDVESLYPPSLAALPVDEFMAAAVALDVPMRDRVNQAAEEGNVLRYVAEVTGGIDAGGINAGGSGAVRLKALPKAAPLANLKYISFQTAIYDNPPLMVGGKGAGAEMTAAGVLGDMVGLAREMVW
jgi:homoserine dehydrogenase